MSAEEWRSRFAEYKAALATHKLAQACVDRLERRLATSAADDERAALEAGLAVAQRRTRRACRRLDAATSAFTEGRSVMEAIWSAPDEI